MPFWPEDSVAENPILIPSQLQASDFLDGPIDFCFD